MQVCGHPSAGMVDNPADEPGSSPTQVLRLPLAPLLMLQHAASCSEVLPTLYLQTMQ